MLAVVVNMIIWTNSTEQICFCIKFKWKTAQQYHHFTKSWKIMNPIGIFHLSKSLWVVKHFSFTWTFIKKWALL